MNIQASKSLSSKFKEFKYNPQYQIYSWELLENYSIKRYWKVVQSKFASTKNSI